MTSEASLGLIPRSSAARSFIGKFKVLQEWYNSKNVRVKYYIHMFDYFFDFVAFMKGDLSEAHLLFCDGLQNLNDVSEINFKNTIVKSIVCDKFDIQYELYKGDNSRLKSLSLTEENEKSRELATLNTTYGVELLGYQMTKEQVYYVSDIHLLHKLRYFEAEFKDDVAYIIKSYVENIVKESGNTILIGGDVSSSFAIFEMFIKSLRSELDSRRRGDIRVYADNQIGYKKYDIHMKCFDIEYEYNYFENYDDGIYEITAQEYERFYRSKNIPLNCNWDVNILYMLKKNGYYCFIHESKGGSLTILNGGSRKKLDIDDINYYYENMDSVVAFIKKPLDTYTNFQENIAAEIKKIGGSGNIHGCIIDIDWFNHVYVNPSDMKITGYWASDKKDKQVYSSVPALLKQKCPYLFKNLTQENSNNLPILANYINNDLDQPPQIYYDTDIYNSSGEVNKMQKLYFNILTTWYEVGNTNKVIELK